MTPVRTRPGARRVGGLLAAAFLLFGGSPFCRAAAPAPGDLQTPPLQDGNPVKVAVSLHIINIASIDEVKEQFEIDAYLMTRWIDPRLAFTPTRPTSIASTVAPRSGSRPLRLSMPSRRANATTCR